MKYAVTVGSRTFEIEIQGSRARIDGRDVTAALHALPGSVERQLVLPDGIQTFAMTRTDAGWELVRAGEVLRARVVDERTQALEAMAARPGPAAGVHVIRAPMPGLVVRVEVQPGATVRAGQGVVVLEAMKMENELTTPGPGVVRAVRASPGQAVEKGAVLVEVVGQG